jgi:tRNA-specific 2-thiouridylase
MNINKMQQNRFHQHKAIPATKVVVAMSGGVDSSTVAAMLHHEGYEVIGITLQLYDMAITLEKKGACCAGVDIYDAMQVAAKLGIPHYVLNYEDLFKQSVMEDFADSYLQGETPIPCIRCNQSVKFRDLLKVAKDLGADALATGHYVQRIDGAHGAELHQGMDAQKDQSYFLFATTSAQLDFLYFPLGNNTKEQTRNLAVSYGLVVADKPDSQDICFVPNGSYASVVSRLRPGALEAGDIVDLAGNVLGRHDGIINFTIGQRKGLKISGQAPLYVVKINPHLHQVVVGPESALGKSFLKIKEINWLAHELDTSIKIEVEVKLRSTQMPVKATLEMITNTNEGKIHLHSPQKSITPGQACVIYRGSRVLGGGWIMRD